MKINEIVAESSDLNEGPLSALKAAANSKLVQKAAEWKPGSGIASAVTGGVKDAGTVLKAFANLGTGFAKLVTSLGVIYELGKTYSNIQSINKKFKAGQITPAEYEQQLQAELGYMATQFVAAGLVKFVFAAGGAIMGTIPILKWFAPIVKWASGPAGAAFLVWVQTPAGQETFAKWFVGAIMEEGFAGATIDFISSYTKKFYDMIMQRTKEAEKNTASATGQAAGDAAEKPETDDDFWKKLAAEKPASDAQEFDPATGTWLNKPKLQ